jgi:hypothetical protein
VQLTYNHYYKPSQYKINEKKEKFFRGEPEDEKSLKYMEEKRLFVKEHIEFT